MPQMPSAANIIRRQRAVAASRLYATPILADASRPQACRRLRVSLFSFIFFGYRSTIYFTSRLLKDGLPRHVILDCRDISDGSADRALLLTP